MQHFVWFFCQCSFHQGVGSSGTSLLRRWIILFYGSKPSKQLSMVIWVPGALLNFNMGLQDLATKRWHACQPNWTLLSGKWLGINFWNMKWILTMKYIKQGTSEAKSHNAPKFYSNHQICLMVFTVSLNPSKKKHDSGSLFSALNPN